MKYYIFTFITLSTTLTISLFQGCSGHALQDLIDAQHPDNTSPKQKSTQPNNQKIVPPSENSALNSISPSATSNDKHQEDRYLQKTLVGTSKQDNEVNQEIMYSVTESNITNKNNNISNDKNSTVDDNSSFTLQHYVNELGDYMDEKERRDANKTKAPSHAEKINAMPGIGKAKKR